MALRLAADPDRAALLSRWRVAGLAPIQLQVVPFNQVCDSHWTDMALDAARRAGWLRRGPGPHLVLGHRTPPGLRHPSTAEHPRRGIR